MSHKTSHKLSHIALPRIAHTIQRNGSYHYKKRVNKTFVQFSLKTRDPQLAGYLVTRIDREIMSTETELDLSQIIQKIKNQKPNFSLNSLEAKKALKALEEGFSDPENVVDIPGIHIDQENGEEERKTIQMLFADHPDLLREALEKAIRGGGGGGGGGTKSEDTKLAFQIEKFLEKKKDTDNVSTSTLKNIEKHLQRYSKYIKVDDLLDIKNSKHMEYTGYLVSKEKCALSAATANNEIATINAFRFFIGPEKKNIVTLSKLDNIPSTSSLHNEKQPKLPFSEEQLKDVFNILNDFKNNEQHRVLTILAFMTGARRSELGQLERKDFMYKEGIYYLDINNIPEDTDDLDSYDETIKSVKNQRSKRAIPIPDCILPYVKSIHSQSQSKKGTALFFGINENQKGRGDTVSRAFVYQLRKKDYNNQYVFHSARHSFKNFAHKLKLDEAYTEKLMGHAPQRKSGDKDHTSKVARDVYLAEDLGEMKGIVEEVAKKYYLDFIDTLQMKVDKFEKL